MDRWMDWQTTVELNQYQHSTFARTMRHGKDNRGKCADNSAGRNLIRTIDASTSIIPPILRWMPFLLQPFQFSWLGTGTKYAGLHTWRFIICLCTFKMLLVLHYVLVYMACCRHFYLFVTLFHLLSVTEYLHCSVHGSFQSVWFLSCIYKASSCVFLCRYTFSGMTVVTVFFCLGCCHWWSHSGRCVHGEWKERKYHRRMFRQEM